MDTQTPDVTSEFPLGLRKWVGFSDGGVRRTFVESSGRPNKSLIETRLLRQLQDWSVGFVEGGSVPRIILLVGGPGNGKTEAAEEAVRLIERGMPLHAQDLVKRVSDVLAPDGGSLGPRSASVGFTIQGAAWNLVVVPDASVCDQERPGTEAELLVGDLVAALDAPTTAYIACVNRGILDDALSGARAAENDAAVALLSEINEAIALTPSSGGCWPLSRNPAVAVWPMDAESAFVQHSDGDSFPAAQLFKQALDAEKWPSFGSCAAGSKCPFCTSRDILAKNDHRELGHLLKMLRWHELSTGKRWTFRDIFSLVSYLFAGDPVRADGKENPCEWARLRLDEVDELANARTHRARSAVFQLAASQYHHMMMVDSDESSGRRFLSLLNQIEKVSSRHKYIESRAPVLYGLGAFLRDGHPHTRHVASHLNRFREILDPSYIDPNLTGSSGVGEDAKGTGFGSDDIRRIELLCSEQAIGDVAEYYSPFKEGGVHRLTELDYDVLRLLHQGDIELSILLSDVMESQAVRLIVRAQKFVRYFAARFAKRSLGTRLLVVNAAKSLSLFEGLVDGSTLPSSSEIHYVAQELEEIVNSGERSGFIVSLNTTFGQTDLPHDRAAHAITQQRVVVRPSSSSPTSGPGLATPFVDVLYRGRDAELRREVALTYELFQAVSLLRDCLLIESMSSDAVAMIDIVRAQVAGAALRGSLYRLGLRLGGDENNMVSFAQIVDSGVSR